MYLSTVKCGTPGKDDFFSLSFPKFYQIGGVRIMGVLPVGNGAVCFHFTVTSNQKCQVRLLVKKLSYQIESIWVVLLTYLQPADKVIFSDLKGFVSSSRFCRAGLGGEDYMRMGSCIFMDQRGCSIGGSAINDNMLYFASVSSARSRTFSMNSGRSSLEFRT